jgi:protease I
MPDKLRREPKVVALVRGFHERRQLIAAVCHGSSIPISAKVSRSGSCLTTPSEIASP